MRRNSRMVVNSVAHPSHSAESVGPSFSKIGIEYLTEPRRLRSSFNLVSDTNIGCLARAKLVMYAFDGLIPVFWIVNSIGAQVSPALVMMTYTCCSEHHGV